MNDLNYMVEFEYATMGLLGVLFVIYCVRRRYPGLSNRIYISMVFCTFMSAAAHAAAILTLPHAAEIPDWVNYTVHCSYLFYYNFQAILYLKYVLAIVKRNKVDRVNNMIMRVLALTETALLVTTPFTRLLIYFDEDSQYTHGPVFLGFLGIAVVIFIYAAILFVRYRKNLTNVQRAAIAVFELSTILSALVQLLFKAVVVGNFAIAVALVMLVVILQNPDDFTDKIADCYNGEAFYLSVEDKIEDKIPFTAVAFRFDGLNYIKGHFSVGNQNKVLAALGQRLRSEFGKADIYHLGNCRFAMLTNEKHHITEKYIIDRLQRHFSKPVMIGDIEGILSPRIILVRCPELARTAEEVRDALEYTLRAAKSAEESVLVADTQGINSAKRTIAVLSAIKKAIIKKSFEVYYQPIYSSADRGFICAEALIRMKDSELGFVSPDEFIPLAESNGMIMEVGELVFRKVCELMKSGKPQALGIRYIEVNLSTAQCMNDGLADHLTEIMKEYGVSPEQINFEITETAGLESPDVLKRNMYTLISRGSTFSMDDYGTGFSTANYLITLPMEIVKIDKSILWPAMENDEAFVILKHTVAMLKNLNKEIVVEGVETEEMASLLIDMGCDFLQGYFYSKPVPAEDFLKFLEKNYKNPLTN